MHRQERNRGQREKEQREKIQGTPKRQARRMEKKQKRKSSNDDRLAPTLRSPAKKSRQDQDRR